MDFFVLGLYGALYSIRHIPKITKMASFFLMHNLITERTPAAPWRRRNAGLVRASRLSFGWVPGARAVQLAKPNSGQKWRFGWLRPRANPKRRQNTKEARGRGQDRRWQSANASRTRVPMLPHSDRLYVFREVESRSSFWRHRPTAGYARHFTHTAARACSPTIPTTTPT